MKYGMLYMRIRPKYRASFLILIEAVCIIWYTMKYAMLHGTLYNATQQALLLMKIIRKTKALINDFPHTYRYGSGACEGTSHCLLQQL